MAGIGLHADPWRLNPTPKATHAMAQLDLSQCVNLNLNAAVPQFVDWNGKEGC
jgi:hypothetical protein